jgi:hypothetical protein
MGAAYSRKRPGADLAIIQECFGFLGSSGRCSLIEAQVCVESPSDVAVVKISMPDQPVLEFFFLPKLQ